MIIHLPHVILADSGALLAQVPSAPPVAGDATGAGTTPGSTTQPAGTTQAQPQSPFGGQFLFLLLGLMVFMIVMSVVSGRREKKRRAELLASVSRHDRVMLTGGMIGTVADIKGEEIVVRVDDSTNTRIHFARSAVQSVLKSSGSGHTADADADETSEQLIASA